MNTQKYDGRLPAIRVSDDILEKLKGWAFAHQITLAEAHRQVLARGLDRNIVKVPIVGRIITDENGKGQFVIDAREGAA